MHTETDAAVMSLALAICDSLIDSSLLTVEALSKRLSVAGLALEEQKLPIAAGIVGTVRAAIEDRDAAAARRNLTVLLTAKERGEKH